MRFRSTAILLLVFAVLGAYVYFSEFRGKEERTQRAAAEKKAIQFAPKEIAELTLSYDDIRITGVRKAERQWEIASPPGVEADSDSWESLATSITDIQREQASAGNASDLAPFGLDRPRLSVSVKLTDGRSVQVAFGSENPSRTLSYIKISDTPDILMTSSKADAFRKSLSDLRNKKLLDFESESIDAVSVVDRSDSSRNLSLAKSGDAWLLKQPIQVKADTAEIATLLSTVQFARATGFADSSVTVSDAGLAPPALQLTLHDTKKMTDHVLLVGKLAETGKYYVKDGSRPTIFVADNQIADQIHRPAFDWRDKVIATFDRFKLEGIEIVRGADKLSLLKGSANMDEWKLPDGRKLQWDKISSMLNALDFERARDIIDSPKPLAAYGLDKPRMEVLLKEAGGKELRLSFGTDSQTPMGLYLKTSSTPAVVVVSTDVYDKFNLKVDDLVEAKAGTPGTP